MVVGGALGRGPYSGCMSSPLSWLLAAAMPSTFSTGDGRWGGRGPYSGWLS